VVARHAPIEFRFRSRLSGIHILAIWHTHGMSAFTFIPSLPSQILPSDVKMQRFLGRRLEFELNSRHLGPSPAHVLQPYPSSTHPHHSIRSCPKHSKLKSVYPIATMRLRFEFDKHWTCGCATALQWQCRSRQTPCHLYQRLRSVIMAATAAFSQWPSLSLVAALGRASLEAVKETQAEVSQHAHDAFNCV
jgi:hypothetical protein